MPQLTPTTLIVCCPIAVAIGIVTAVWNWPLASAFTVSSSTGSECNTIWMDSPGVYPSPDSVSTPPGLTCDAVVVTAGVLPVWVLTAVAFHLVTLTVAVASSVVCWVSSTFWVSVVCWVSSTFSVAVTSSVTFAVDVEMPSGSAVSVTVSVVGTSDVTVLVSVIGTVTVMGSSWVVTVWVVVAVVVSVTVVGTYCVLVS